MRPLITAFVLLLTLPSGALAAPPKGFDARVEALRQSVGAPAVSIAIVEDGKVTLTRAYGVKQLGRPDRADPDTIFQLGSVSKAFTAAALATLVDEGRIKWDDKVIDHLPYFRMYDPWVTREITVRDLLVHRSGLGLGQGDLLFLPATTIGRKDAVMRLRHLKPATSFRSAYAYDNVLYMVAGQLIEEVTGQPWETYVRDRLLRPAGMTHAVTSEAERVTVANRAMPHSRMGEIHGSGPQEALDEGNSTLGANGNPAGAISASAKDMARWLQVQLNGGRVPDSDKALFSTATRDEMWRGVTPVPISPLPGDLAKLTPQFKLYGLGWNVQDYRGRRIIVHGGGVLGGIATVVLMPETNTGIAIMINSQDSKLLSGLQWELIDHYLGQPKADWPAVFDRFFTERLENGAAAAAAAKQARPASSKPALPASAYAGEYADPWYGPIAISERNGGLFIDFRQTPGMVGPLEHWARDTFVARFTHPHAEPAYVTFAVDASGKVERITMKAFSPVADFSYDYHDLLFTPVVKP
ncbi:MAG TPA: serine hydrolase [Caulobacteraceae bacterium]|jgi:CubicO group peptidase (beta-lactamase class C family)